MRRSLLAFAAACAALMTAPAGGREQAPSMSAAVLRDGETWTVDFRFRDQAPAWAFHHSALTEDTRREWRAGSWTVLTPGVRIERRGHYDLLRSVDGGPVPAHVQVRFTPTAEALAASYDPALRFSDGSVALYTASFHAFPLASAAEADTLPVDLAHVPAAANSTLATFRDRAGPVLHFGRRVGEAIMQGGHTYTLFGPAQPIATADMATIIDPQLPAWLRAELGTMTPRILAALRERLGPPPGELPTFYISWAGPTGGPERMSMKGSVLPSLVLMRWEGAGVQTANPRITDYARWFIAHEASHFWLGQAVRYQFGREAWITEGGADLLALRLIAGMDPAFDARARLQRLLDECIGLARGRGVASAEERGENRAYYACGAMIGLAAEASTGRDIFRLTRDLIAANRSDGIVSRADWFAAFARAGGRQTVADQIAALLDTGSDDPASALARLFTAAGVAHSRTAQGGITLS